jgi:hypothetical protein
VACCLPHHPSTAPTVAGYRRRVRTSGELPHEDMKRGAVCPHRGTPLRFLRGFCWTLGCRANDAPVLAAGQRALGLALQLPYALARDPEFVGKLG